MDKSYDDAFSQIADLKWLPWVGENYNDNNIRILVVGESHYHDNTQQTINSSHSTSFTREVVNDLAINSLNKRSPFFQNFHLALLETNEFDSTKFWNQVAFYNFIQKPMTTSMGRPPRQDFVDGWKVFFETIRILKPTLCIFVGTTAANYYSNSIKSPFYKDFEIQWNDRIGNAYAKSTELYDESGNSTKVVFIKHTSKYFNWMNWNIYLRNKVPDELRWLSYLINSRDTDTIS